MYICTDIIFQKTTSSSMNEIEVGVSPDHGREGRVKEVGGGSAPRFGGKSMYFVYP